MLDSLYYESPTYYPEDMYQEDYGRFPEDDVFSSVNPPISYVRLLHASPNTPAVDVYVNGNVIARNLSYRNFTPYLTLPAGNYTVTLFNAGTTVNPILSTPVTIPPNTILTVAVIGTRSQISLLPVADMGGSLAPGTLGLKFVHLSPNTPNVDLALQGGATLFRNVPYKGITDYAHLRPGQYAFEVRVAGTNNRVLFVPNIRLLPNRYYSFYLIGLVDGRPGLQALIPLDGNSYLKV